MTVTAKPMPDPNTILAAYDQEARRSVEKARDAISPLVATETPHRTGQMASALRPKVTRTSTGYALRVAAPRGARSRSGASIADVVAWVTKGTGQYNEYAPARGRIHAKNRLKRLTLPGGQKRWSVSGQHPNKFISRIRDRGTQRFDDACSEGALEANRQAALLIGGK